MAAGQWDHDGCRPAVGGGGSSKAVLSGGAGWLPVCPPSCYGGGGGGTPESLEHLYKVYRQMLDEAMEKIVDVIMNAGSNVLYFCTAGKDRTGVVSAVILKRLGFSDEAVIDDYMQSKDNLMEMLTDYAQAHPEVDLEIIVPHRKNMEQFLQYLHEGPQVF